LKPFCRQASFFVALLFAVGCSPKTEPPPPRPSGVEDTATALRQRALERRKAHAWSEALADYNSAKQLAPDDPDVHRGVKLFERLSPFLGAVREIDARLAANPEDDQLLCDRALLFLRADDSELALMDARAAAQKAEWAVRPKLFGAIALIDQNREDESEQLGIERPLRLSVLTPEFLETVSRLDGEISVERDNAELYVARAWQLNEIGQPRLALADAETALRLDDKSAHAHLERGYALNKLGHPDEALEQLCRATELDPNLAIAWQYRGELELARGEYQPAVNSLSHALTLSPTYGALEKRAQAYEQLGQNDKAEEDRHALEAMR
jgi:tetratricopeptide (TPR) repeat protein